MLVCSNSRFNSSSSSNFNNDTRVLIKNSVFVENSLFYYEWEKKCDLFFGFLVRL